MNKYFKLKILLLLGIVILGSVLTTIFLKDEHKSTQKNREAIVTLIEEVWSKGNLDIVDQLIDLQYTIRHDPGDQWEGKTLDISTFKERVRMSRDVFPDQQFHIEDLVCEGDKCAVSWKFTGTQKGNIPGLPTTNKKVTVSGLTIYYFSKGKIIGHWQEIDRLGFLRQLGVHK